MKAAWYEKPGPAKDVLVVGEMPDPHPGPGEVRIRVAASGINPGDTKKRSDVFGLGLAFPRIIPHSDGAGVVDELGPGVAPEWLGKAVWCFGAQSYRPFGTAAEYTVRARRSCRGAAGGRVAGAGRVPRHPRHYGASGGACCRASRRQDRAGAGRGGLGRALCACSWRGWRARG